MTLKQAFKGFPERSSLYSLCPQSDGLKLKPVLTKTVVQKKERKENTHAVANTHLISCLVLNRKHWFRNIKITPVNVPSIFMRTRENPSADLHLILVPQRSTRTQTVVEPLSQGSKVSAPTVKMSSLEKTRDHLGVPLVLKLKRPTQLHCRSMGTANAKTGKPQHLTFHERSDGFHGDGGESNAVTLGRYYWSRPCRMRHL